ncbi:MAG: glycoside hydrolase family 9 protein [Ruminococcus flavefaciens]|nr:glycoside hydrolase family 9 protein [Ruminococcus flavefaciens]MCM1228722.1 glycoside hydrolase family 9 protein [Ruminococcus flavefaciens]
MYNKLIEITTNERSVMLMYSRKSNKIKSAILSGMFAAVSVAGSFTAVAPSLTSNAAGSDNYAKILQYSLYFYDANMCGDQVGKTSGMTWRDDCHTGDEVKGGFHDAGDHAMFGLPQGYTASVLGWSYYEFKDGYNNSGQAEHLKVITDYFCDFFKASTKLNGDSVSSFLYQKEDGNVDHAYWGTPENQENVQGKRKMYWTSSGASDIAADYAAALALNYINFGNAEDLKYAEALYKFSTQYNQVASDGPQGFYSSSGYQDEQANAAGWLYLATGNESYKNDCASKQTEYLGWADGWDNRGLGAACVYAHITGNWNKVNQYIQETTTQKTQNGYYCLDEWGSARLNGSMQFTALVATKNSSADFLDWSKGQMSYLTGNNPMNVCFVTGMESNSAKNPHHRAASGYTSYDDMGENQTQVKAGSPTLIGALVGGPKDSNGNYTDSLTDYVCNEVAIDYNAGFTGAAAGLYELTKSGSTVSAIEGVDKIYNGTVSSNPIVTTPVVTTPTPSTSNGTYKVDINQKIVYSQLPADDKMIGFDWSDFNINFNETVQKVVVNISANGNIGKWEGAFGSTTSVSPSYWTQSSDMTQNISGNKGSITWEVSASDAKLLNTTSGDLKFGVWWIDCGEFTIDSIEVITDAAGSSSNTTTTTQPVQTNPTQSSTTQTPVVVSKDVVLTSGNMTIGSEKGDDGEMNNYAEFSPQGAKSATLYYKVNSNDTNTSGAFGTWNGTWEQTDFENISVPSDKVVAVDYTIPSNVGSTVKAMVFWPHGDAVTIEKVVLHMEETQTQTTQSTTKTTTTTTTTVTTKTPSQSGKYLAGDANEDGVVDVADAAAIIQSLGNKDKYALSAQGAINAEVDGVSGITGMDAITIQKVAANLIDRSELPLKG